MQNLLPFQPLSSGIFLEGDLQRLDSKLILSFKVTDPNLVLQLPPAFACGGADVLREDGLWNATCFEMFLRPQGQKKYYEFNFSLKPAWNEYIFNDYRDPQPPQASKDISLQQMQWNGHVLKVELSGVNHETSFEISLAAVLKEVSGLKHYMALAHKADKADFHHADSFILRR